MNKKRQTGNQNHSQSAQTKQQSQQKGKNSQAKDGEASSKSNGHQQQQIRGANTAVSRQQKGSNQQNMQQKPYLTSQQQLSVSSANDMGNHQQIGSYQKQRVASQKKINYQSQPQPQQQNNDNVRENRLVNPAQQRVNRDVAGSVGGQGPSASTNLAQGLENTSHPQNLSAAIQGSKSTTRFPQKGAVNAGSIASSQAVKGGQIVQASHTPQSAQSMDQRAQVNHQTTSSYGGGGTSNYGTRSMHQQARNAFSSQQKQLTRSAKQDSSIANIDSSSQSSMSTNAKAWDVKGGRQPTQSGKLDSQNTGKCDNCRYRVSKQERILYDCGECGSYIICQYCYDDFMDKNYQQTKGSSAISNISLSDGSESSNSDEIDEVDGQPVQKKASKSISSVDKIKCIYCWSKKTLTDVCVKSMKSFGYNAKTGQLRIPVTSLSKDKVRKLANLRVIQKTLVYVIGLAPDIASESKIRSLDLFGQYGKIEKVVINTNNVYNSGRGGPSYSGYITFSNPRDSAKAILAVDQFMFNDRLIRASFGTSKFCQFFLSGQKCTNKDCLYLHELRSDLEAYTKEDMQNNKIIFQEQQKIAIKLSKALEMNFEEFKKFNIEQNQKLKEAYQKNSNFKHNPILPKADIIFEKSYHFMSESLLEKQLRKQKKLQKKAIAQSSKSQSTNKQTTDVKIQDKQADSAKDDQGSDTSFTRITDTNDKDTGTKSGSAEPTQSLEVQEQLKSDEKDNTNHSINFQNQAKVLINDGQKESQNGIQLIGDLKERDREPLKVNAKETVTMVNTQKQVGGAQAVAQQKNAKNQKQSQHNQGAGNSVTIQLQNVKDLQHDQIDRSLSKIRVSNKVVNGLSRIANEIEHAQEVINATSSTNVGPNPHSNLQNVLQNNIVVASGTQKEETSNKQSFIDKLQISPELQKGNTDVSTADGNGASGISKKEITSLNLNVSDQVQAGHIAQRPAIKESGRFQVKQKKKNDVDDNQQCVPEQRQNLHHQKEAKMSPRGQEKQPIKETTSVDARQLGNKIGHHQHQIQADGKAPNPRVQGPGQKSQERIESIFTDIFSGTENFNMTMQSSKTLETSKNKDGPPNGDGSTCGKLTNGFNIGDNINTTYSKTTYSISDQQLIKAAAEQFMQSPYIFQKKKESRFKFAHQVAHSVDPLHNNQKMVVDDDDEILVPKNIQDLIERGIRTYSNSLSNVKSNVNDMKSTAAQEMQEEQATGIKIKTLNKMLQEEETTAEAQLMEIKELKERWYTKQELKKIQERGGAQPSIALTLAQQHLLSPSPGIKGLGNAGGMTTGPDLTTEQSTTNPSPSVGGNSYNVTRVKYQIKQNAVFNIEEEKSQQQQTVQSSTPSDAANQVQTTQQQLSTRQSRRNKNHASNRKK